jgi:hypothetical protein
MYFHSVFAYGFNRGLVVGGEHRYLHTGIGQGASEVIGAQRSSGNGGVIKLVKEEDVHNMRFSFSHVRMT